MKRIILPVSVFLFLFLPGFASAETVITSSIFTDTVWAKDASPYIIRGDIEVETSATLTIQPGVVVKFGRDVYGGDHYLFVKGGFVINGLPEDKVYFTTIDDDLSGNDPEGYYNWLILLQSPNNVSISNAVFSHFYYLGFNDSPNVSLNNIDVRDTSGGVSFYNVGTATIENSHFSNIRYNGVASNSGDLSIRNSVIENMQYGMAVQSNGNLEIVDSQVKEVTEGIAVSASNGNVTIQNSIFENGSGSVGLSFSKTNTTISSSSISGFGYEGVYVTGGSFNADNITVSNNSGGGLLFEDEISGPPPMFALMSAGSGDQETPPGSTLESAFISQSRILGNSEFGLKNDSGINVNVENNWWGDSTGPKNTITNQNGLGNEIIGNVDFDPWLTGDPNVTPTFQTINPVIIIPGIVGTELYNGSDLIWLDLSQTATDINDQFLTENLSLDTNGDSVLNILVGNVIKRIQALIVFDTNIFEDLSLDLQNKSNYQENQNLFFFPYDWRLDLSQTKDLLKQKIDEVKDQTGAQKVNIIAHSMGGLLVKDYLNSYGKNSVDKLIFVGTPHLGAPKAGKVLLEGDRFSIPWLEEDRIKEIAQNSPALHELLPNPTYFNQFQGYFRKYSLFGNNPLLNYAETKDFFLNNKNENPIMFQKTEDFYNQNLDNLDFSGIDTYNIVGCKTPTQVAYSFGVLNEIGQIGYTSGDGTVPIVSADYINIPNSNKFYVENADHAELPSTDGVRDLILEILNGDAINLATNVSNNSSFCNFKGKKLTWHSPVEVHIYDSNGNHTGPIENNAIEYGIPGIDYDVVDHNKFIFLPTDAEQEYLVEAKGLEEGSFDLSISEVDNGQYLTTWVFNDVIVTTLTTANFVINNSENNIIELENEGEVIEVESDATLNGEDILDLVPPETTAEAVWVKNKKSKKNLQITLTAIDNQSGILETVYSLDEGDTFNIYSEPIVVDKKTDEILFYSVDKAGNDEDIKEFNLRNDKFEKCKSWKCLDMNKKHNRLNKVYKKTKDDKNKQEKNKKFKIKK